MTANNALVIASAAGILSAQVVCKYRGYNNSRIILLVQLVPAHRLANFHPRAAVAHYEFSQTYFSNQSLKNALLVNLVCIFL